MAGNVVMPSKGVGSPNAAGNCTSALTLEKSVQYRCSTHDRFIKTRNPRKLTVVVKVRWLRVRRQIVVSMMRQASDNGLCCWSSSISFRS